MSDKGRLKDKTISTKRARNADINDIVLDSHIFSNVFAKDIKRVFIYKKAERLAKAIHLITPAFTNSPTLRNKIDSIAVSLVEYAILPPASARELLSRELLALSSVLSIAHTGGMLSSMNTEIIAKEAHTLLQEVASYEEPRLFLEETPSLAELARNASSSINSRERVAKNENTYAKSFSQNAITTKVKKHAQAVKVSKGQTLKDNTVKTSRRDAIVSIIRKKGDAYIKDISTVIRNVSEKTIQRELVYLVNKGILVRKGTRRWTSYSIAN
ncbi:hypothetical protein MNBD_CPR01-218 [hydrothermal vent metagenome]|uniref:HTH deoR-type domain-containing protein n=1 Tax=hydrothermal vent metagenome TaxID=652676 RepID=A0A3B0V3U6_9ZZZZ